MSFKILHNSKIYKDHDGKWVEESLIKEKLITLKEISNKHKKPLINIFTDFLIGLDSEDPKEVVKQNLFKKHNFYSIIDQRNKIKKITESEINYETEIFDKHKLDQIPSFSKRLEYCSKFLEKIGSGSRIVFILSDKSVLKLAKNQKGLEQNNFEIDVESDITTKIFDHDNLGTWIESEMASKISPQRFKQLTGFDIKTVGEFLINDYSLGKGKNTPFNLPNELVDELYDNDIISSLVFLMQNYDLDAGDFGKITSYGEVNGKLVVVDYGGSNEIISSYYRKMNEVIEFAKHLYKKDLLENKIDKKNQNMRYWIKENWKYLNK